MPISTICWRREIVKECKAAAQQNFNRGLNTQKRKDENQPFESGTKAI
jgi:hypothetical protein